MAGFFVDHALSDNLGVIANAHLALADLSADVSHHAWRGRANSCTAAPDVELPAQGVTNPKCLRLAELHSNAVDFPKTGIPVEVPNDLRPQRFPDFMEKLDKESYKSRTILGVMYRQIQVGETPPAVPQEAQKHTSIDHPRCCLGGQGP